MQPSTPLGDEGVTSQNSTSYNNTNKSPKSIKNNQEIQNDDVPNSHDAHVSASTPSTGSSNSPDSPNKENEEEVDIVPDDELLDYVQECFSNIILCDKITQEQIDKLQKFISFTLIRLCQEGSTMLLRKLITFILSMWDPPSKTISENSNDHNNNNDNNNIESNFSSLNFEILDLNVKDEKSNERDTPMHYAAQNDEVGCMHVLKEFGADCHIRNDDGRTPLHLAAMYGASDAVRFLITKGQVEVNEYDDRGTASFSSVTPIQLSMVYRKYETAKILVYFGAQVSAPSRSLIFSSGVNNRGKTVAEIPVDQYGFIVDENSENKSKDQRSSHQVKKDRQRASKWADMIEPSEQSFKNQEKAKERARKGIPHNVRGVAWYHMTNARRLQKQEPQRYDQLKHQNTPDSGQIDNDIERTFRDHILFHERFGERQTALFNVLRAYSNYNPTLGYCQGMATIAAFLLMHVKNEERVFWMLVDLISSYGIESNFTHGLVGAQQSFYIHNRLLKKLMPKLFQHLERNDVGVSFYATKWYMELFIGSMPFEFTLRAWDIFLSHGYKSIFLLAMALLHFLQPRLMQADGIEEIRNVLKVDVFKMPLDIDHLVKYYRRHNISKRRLEKYREESKNADPVF
eukprot:gb/GECH01002243.1/.p1 GENE.gb/GECH01002243.1/~~gb/GECH01002243.1/.p1  ORF type:complete len:629 (+),score=180.76 gb/GECH01002243.1/:1-1887(+)